jgi:hypothetical protein
MNRNAGSKSVASPLSGAGVAEDSQRLLTEDGHGRKCVKQAKELPPVVDSPEIPRVHKNGNRIGINQRMRILQKYVVGKTKIDIAKEERVDRETVRRIVKCPEMDAYVEEKREMWRGLCDPAIEVLRKKLQEGDKEVALRILESNSVIPPRGSTLNHNIQTATKPSQDDRVKNLRAAFADVMLERAKVFKTPFPELAEIAEQHNIEVGLDLRGASDEAEEDEI